MSDQPIQNFANHRSVDKNLYLVAGLLLVAGIWSVVRFKVDSVPTLCIVVAALVIALRMRVYSTRLQDRIIRLEMKLRLERLLSGDLAARVGELSLPQIIGLRFASDDELPGLMTKVLSEKIAKANDIKQLVKNWQADHLRV